MFFSLARVVAAILILPTPITAQCFTNGRVGENSGCQYKCHCEGDAACDRDTGACQGKCDPQWFGPACQYASLNFAPSEQLAWLTDNDDETCNDGSRPVQSITVRLDTPQRLSWVRVMVNESDHLRQFQLTYRTESSRGFSSCPSGQSAKVNDFTLDISCPTVEVVSELKLSGSGVTALCSLYISDGNNLTQPETGTIFVTRYARLVIPIPTYGACNQTPNRLSKAARSIRNVKHLTTFDPKGMPCNIYFPHEITTTLQGSTEASFLRPGENN
ncbi:fibrinogen-related molecule [Plakobranchus ocellatus]|uniref:Fibrinogen-related molecule n=1 Tax=Plakobranchus ocellatus TaxID=259542 RepID=A0AAV3YYG8_9GAST|nr:fibrinogen-related molecule [Plakobranchus ocellatus]